MYGDIFIQKDDFERRVAEHLEKIKRLFSDLKELEAEAYDVLNRYTIPDAIKRSLTSAVDSVVSEVQSAIGTCEYMLMLYSREKRFKIADLIYMKELVNRAIYTIHTSKQNVSSYQFSPKIDVKEAMTLRVPQTLINELLNKLEKFSNIISGVWNIVDDIIEYIDGQRCICQ